MSIIKYCIAALATIGCVMAAQGSIVEREYWFDNNFVESHSLGSSPTALDISSLPPGLHWFSMRVKDGQGVWSSAMTKAFIIPHEVDNSTATTIQRREVWFDNNVAERQAIGAAPVMLDISSLPAGLHSLTIRVQDDLGLWSSQKTIYFVIPHEEVEEDVELVSYCYWFDDDLPHLVVGTLPVSGKTVAGVIEVDIATVPTSGEHTLHWMIGDSKGAWGMLSTTANSTTFVNSRGDVNDDGEVTITDAIALINYVLNDDATGVNLANADCNLDGVVNISDAIALISYVLNSKW